MLPSHTECRQRTANPPEHIVQHVIVPLPRLCRQARHQLSCIRHQRPPAVQRRLQAEEVLGGVQHLGVQLNRVCTQAAAWQTGSWGGNSINRRATPAAGLKETGRHLAATAVRAHWLPLAITNPPAATPSRCMAFTAVPMPSPTCRERVPLGRSRAAACCR